MVSEGADSQESMNLQTDGEFEIGAAEIGKAAGIAQDQVESLIFLHPMAYPDGTLSARAMISFRSKLPSDSARALFQVDIGGEQVHAYNLSDHLPARNDAASTSSAYISVPMGDEVLYVGGTDSAFLISRGAHPAVRKVEIAQRVGDAPRARLRPSRLARPVSTDACSVAMPLEDAAHAGYLAVLNIDRARLAGHWSAYAEQPTDSASPPAMLLASNLPRLVGQDFTQSPGEQVHTPNCSEALIRQGRVFVYTKGYSDSLRYGDPYSAIAEIAPDGRASARPFALDFASMGDGKKRGLAGRFTSSGRYCILTPVYKSADLWQGRQKLFDLERGELVDIALPRGYTKYDLLDHAGEHWWAGLSEAGKPQRMARLRIR